MKIWVDADACPVAIKEIIFKAAERTKVLATFVANHPIAVPRSPYIKMLQVSQGFDVADNEIVSRVSVGDLVITSDIPLAAEIIDAGCFVLSPRGEQFTAENIKARLTMRDFLETMRASGIQSGGPAALSQADRKAFADKFDQILAKRG